MKQKHTHSIKSTFIISVWMPGTLLLYILITSMLFSYFYIKTSEVVYLAVLTGLDALFVIMYISVCVVMIRRLKRYYLDGLYSNTANLLNQLKNNSKDFTRYPETRIRELTMLNDDLDVVSAEFSNATLISHSYNESQIPLEHVGDDEELVTLESLKKYITPLIYSAQNFRNALAELYYSFDDDALEEDEQKEILSQLKKMFADYEYRLFALNEDASGFYIYLPYVESFSHIQELVFNYMKRLSVSKKTYDGISTINARFSLVCYPYSDINDLFSDLRYAKRQGEVIHFYLPNRLSMLGKSKLIQNSMNLNNISRILELLSDLKISSRDRAKSMATIKKALGTFLNYLDIDYAGIVIQNDDDYMLYNMMSVAKGDLKPIFKEEETISREFIEACDKAVDADCSYYFSARSHCNVDLAVYLDKVHISSGFLFTSRDKGYPYAMIYFFNQNRPMIMNSYLREGLFLACHRIGDFLLMVRREDHFNSTYREINAMLSTNDSSLFRIDSDTYDIVSYSTNFETIFKNAKVGEKCYKVLHGSDKPCADCPLVTSKKKYGEIDGTKYVASLSINEKNSKLKRFLLTIIKDEETTYDRFDRDLLISSFPSLTIALRSLYSIHARGYLLVLRVDNHQELLDAVGSEKYLFLMRQFILAIKSLNKDRETIYSFDNQSLAILLPESGQIDVVNLVEQIYEASKKDYKVDDNDYHFNVTYLPYSFPQSFPIAEDFLKYVVRHFNQRNFEVNKDILYFPDGDYSRSASRDQFMLAVIDEQFGNKTFSVALQPMVRTVDKSIYGAELFLRLSDNYRNMVFSADELIKTAAKNGKISLISNALIKYIGELYGQFGLTVFKVYGFNRLTINTDYSYFADPTFHEEIHNLLVDYHLPRDFLGFEITEREIYRHIEDFRKLSKQILGEHIVLACDQYTGKHVSIESLKSMGFSEIKID
ncbi:MAG: EAL domain-containing protein, partial [Bacilli bacterium]|nr:EAL domain-containing protein [Bacilli bacterium]